MSRKPASLGVVIACAIKRSLLFLHSDSQGPSRCVLPTGPIATPSTFPLTLGFALPAPITGDPAPPALAPNLVGPPPTPLTLGKTPYLPYVLLSTLTQCGTRLNKSPFFSIHKTTLSGGARNLIHPRPQAYPTASPQQCPKKLVPGTKTPTTTSRNKGDVQVGIFRFRGRKWK